MFASDDFNKIGHLAQWSNWLNGASLVFLFSFEFVFCQCEMGSRQDTMEKGFDVFLKNILHCNFTVFHVLLRLPTPSFMNCMSNHDHHT